MSSEPKSTIQDPQELEDFRSLAGIPSNVDLLSATEMRPETCPEGFFIIYEYVVKIGLRWLYSPLAKAFTSHFEIAPGATNASTLEGFTSNQTGDQGLGFPF